MEADDLIGSDHSTPSDTTTPDPNAPAWLLKKRPASSHLGYGFVLLNTPDDAKLLLSSSTCKVDKKHMVIFKPIQRTSGENVGSNLCYLWKLGRCSHGDNCKFIHEVSESHRSASTSKYELLLIAPILVLPIQGEGGCLVKGDGKKKCFEWLQKGTCKNGKSCPFRHIESDRGSKKRKAPCPVADGGTPDKAKHCHNWKKKGYCRKGDKCQYLHDPDVGSKALAKRQKRQEAASSSAAVGLADASYTEAAAPSNGDGCVSIHITGYTDPESMKRSRVEGVLREAQCSKPKRVKVMEDGAVCTFSTAVKAGDAMITIWPFRDLFGGSYVNLKYI